MNNKQKPLILCLASLALVACGSQNKPSSASSESSSKASSSETSSSEILSSSEAESSSSEDLQSKFGTAESFLANYEAMMAIPVTKMEYYREGLTTSGKEASKGSIKVDSDELLKTVTPIEDGAELSPVIDYSALTQEIYYHVEDDGSIYSTGERYKIGTPDSLKPDILSLEQAQTKYIEELGHATPGTIAFYSTFKTIDNRAETTSYEFSLSKSGTASIDYNGVVKGSYFGSLYHAEIDLDASGRITGGYFKRSNYMGASWDKEKGEPTEDGTPNSWFSTSFSKIEYGAQPESDLFDPSRYFATSGTGFKYHYYQQLDTGKTKECVNAAVGDYISMSQIDDDKAVLSPSTAIDMKMLYITASRNTDVIGIENVSGTSCWMAKAAGTTMLTLGNSFVPNIATLTVTVE